MVHLIFVSQAYSQASPSRQVCRVFFSILSTLPQFFADMGEAGGRRLQYSKLAAEHGSDELRCTRWCVSRIVWTRTDS